MKKFNFVIGKYNESGSISTYCFFSNEVHYGDLNKANELRAIADARSESGHQIFRIIDMVI